MPLTNYGDLKDEVARWLAREDEETIERIPDFIRLAEGDIYRELRCRENEFRRVLTPASAAGALRQLPENYREMKLLVVNGQPLNPISELEWAARTGRNESSPVWAYCETERTLRLLPDLDADPSYWPADTEVVMTYYGSESLDSLPVWQTPTNPVADPGADVVTTLPTHTDDNTTRLFLVQPQLYLAGAVHYGNLFLDNPKAAAKWGEKFAGYLSALEQETAEADLTGGESLAGIAYGD